MTQPDDSYRSSHLGKGATYDDELAHDLFARYMDDREAAVLRRVIPMLFPKLVPRYVDFACGTGRITSVVEPFAQESFGIDVSASMIDKARHKCARTTFLVADITSAGIPIPPVSLVTAFRFFGNADDELRVAALRAMSELIVPGGYLIVNNHRNPCSIHEVLLRLRGGHSQLDRHERLDLSWWKLRRLLHAAGFQIVRSFPVGAWFLRYRWLPVTLASSRLCAFLEALFGSRALAPFSPDMIIIGRKRRSKEPRS